MHRVEKSSRSGW